MNKHQQFKVLDSTVRETPHNSVFPETFFYWNIMKRNRKNFSIFASISSSFLFHPCFLGNFFTVSAYTHLAQQQRQRWDVRSCALMARIFSRKNRTDESESRISLRGRFYQPVVINRLRLLLVLHRHCRKLTRDTRRSIFGIIRIAFRKQIKRIAHCLFFSFADDDERQEEE